MFDGVLYRILRRKMEDAENDSAQQNDNHRTAVQSSKHVEHYMNDVAQTDSTHDEKRVREDQMEAANAEMKNPALDAQVEAASTEMRSPATVEFSSSEEVTLATLFSIIRNLQ